MERLHVRASSAPLAMKCPGSQFGGLRINENNQPATVGTATHELISDYINRVGAAWDPETARKVCAKHHILDSIDDVVFLSAKAFSIYDDMVESGMIQGAIRTEVAYELEGPGYLLTGHADVVGTVEAVNVVVDWKTGRVRRIYRDQLMAYAILAGGMHKPTRVYTVWVRDGEADFEEFTPKDCRDWLSDFEERVVGWGGTKYVTGSHCIHCPRKSNCPALLEQNRALITTLLPGAPEGITGLEHMDAQVVVAWLHKFQMFDAISKQFRSAWRELVKERDVPDGFDHVWRAVRKKGATSIDVDKALPVLQQHGWTTKDLLGVSKVGVGKLKARLKASVEKGKGAYVMEVMEALEEAGAATRGKGQVEIRKVECKE